MKYKVSKNASGFSLKPVYELLASCQYIFTSNVSMAGVIDQLFPGCRRVIVAGQDMRPAAIKQILIAMGEITEGDELDVVSTLPLFAAATNINSAELVAVAAGKFARSQDALCESILEAVK